MQNKRQSILGLVKCRDHTLLQRGHFAHACTIDGCECRQSNTLTASNDASTDISTDTSTYASTSASTDVLGCRQNREKGPGWNEQREGAKKARLTLL